MMKDSKSRARPSDQALVSDEAPAGLHPPGFDPSREVAAILRDLRQFGNSHLHNGEARTADLLFRAADLIERMEVRHKEERRTDRRRIDRFVAMQSERTGA